MDQKAPINKDRRAYFRIVYPEGHRPKITIRGTSFDILDICEIGIRFLNPDQSKLPGDIFQAVVTLHDDDPFNIIGRIIRVADAEAAMMITIRGIPYKKIITEQAYLRHLND